MKINNLQYQASNGSWIDCENRTDRLIDKCAEYNNYSEMEIMERLEDGQKLEYGLDWCSYIRVKPESNPLSESEQDYHRNHYKCAEETLDY